MTLALPPEAEVRALKGALQQLVGTLGGVEAAASLMDIEKSELARCYSAHEPRRWLSWPRLAALERIAPAPLVTQLLCKLAGGVFLRLPETGAGDGALPMHVIAVAREIGDVSARVTEALGDGVVKPAEAAAIEAEADELIEAAVRLREYARGLQGIAAKRPTIVPDAGDAQPGSADAREALQ